MRLLICSDGTDPADNPTRLGGLIAGPESSPTTLLGIAEKEDDEAALREALDSEAAMLKEQGVEPRIVIRSGEPIRQILAETSATHSLNFTWFSAFSSPSIAVGALASC